MSTSDTVVKVTDAVKETLIGADVEVDHQSSANARYVFARYAKQDGEGGGPLMGEEEFINAIAPPDEDYVS